ncbi:putative Poly(beta-D-mannuronate) C5 epimerase 2 [Magnetospirillum gryphiswaldense MSR-1 v2]|uniref:Poly(Beta-D-mannuronate) C5 epimerase 2 n=1 Tax=Magnetospirillum gryphiswaldense (strain DSM 6361 / JCM 21280 / NBRC 15271 / MSR-1) TaxID=431944 RepID=V6F3G1_MAGGM|nr:FecR domain-containing protein [Magnetospirillum gryphiswaldense]CDK99932.1 putative Poly(beta-D-mannuronate) C5 epimerase 2 [Magnetospirillum gryphiswaldense MSR-1 v2]
MLTQTSASLRDPVVLSATGDHIRVPGADWLDGADLSRDGGDLLLTGSDSVSMVVPGYFDLPNPPALVDDGGMMVTGDWAVRLAGPLAPGQYAQAGGAAAAPAIGTVSNAVGQVQVRHADGTQDAVKNGDAVKVGDIISTGGNGKVGITFDDGSTFALGGNGRMSVDEMTLPDAAGGGGKEVLAIQGGSFSFSSGTIAKSVPDAMQLKTPVANIGVRGTTGAGVAGPEGQNNTVSLLPDADGNVGQMSVSNQAGTQMLSQPGATTQFTSAFTAPPPPVILSPQQIQQQYGDTLQALPPPPSPEQLQQQQQQRQADATTEAQQQAQAEAAEKAAAEQAATEAEAENALNAEGEAAREEATDLFGSLNDLAQALGTDLGLFGQDGQIMMNEIDDLFEQMLGDDGPLFGEFGPDPFGEFGPGEFDLGELIGELGFEIGEIIDEALQDMIDQIEDEALSQPMQQHNLTGGAATITVTDGVTDYIVGVENTADAVTIAANSTLSTGDTFIDYTSGDGDSLTLAAAGPNANWRVAGVETINLSQTTDDNTFAIGSSGATSITLSGNIDSISETQFSEAHWLLQNGDQNWTLTGNMGSDNINMGAGANALYLVDAGNHSASLNNVNNMYFLGSGTHFTAEAPLTNISISGSAGSDSVTLDDGVNAITINAVESVTGGTGLDIVTLAAGGQTVEVSGVESVIGGSGTDSITLAAGGQTIGVSGVETVTGGTGNDIITGSSAAESLVGGLGDDTLIGGGGADTLTGGDGADIYKYAATTDFGDIITSFSHNDDTIVLNMADFSALPSAMTVNSAIDVSFYSLLPDSNFSSADLTGINFVLLTGQTYADAETALAAVSTAGGTLGTGGLLVMYANSNSKSTLAWDANRADAGTPAVDIAVLDAEADANFNNTDIVMV